MCMIASCVTKDFGLIAGDSALYNSNQSQMIFDVKKVFFNHRYLMTYIGKPAYLAKIDRDKLINDIPSVVIYMKDYLRKMKPEVEEIMKSEIADPEDRGADICLFILGVHKKLPTLVQFNSFLNFEPKYLYSANGPKFSTIFYGDENPAKKKLFLESTQYMEKKAHKLEKKGTPLTAGVLGEVLVRGIYKKADEEMLIAPYKKYAGGVVNVAGMWNDGSIFSLSGVQQA